MQRTELHLAQIKRGLIERQSSLWGYNKPVQEIKLSVWGPKGDYVDFFFSLCLSSTFGGSVSILGFPGMLMVKNCLPMQEVEKSHGFNPWVDKIPRRRAQQSTPVFFPGESHGQRSWVGYCPQGCKESDTTEAT